MPDLEIVLQERFGLPAFRAGQREAVAALLAGEDLLVVQPTGHGKSLVYQLAAVLLGGVTVVISPLLALMRDQLGHLETRFGIPAASINSDQDDAANESARRRAAAGEVSILFVSPEQLDNVERFGFLAGLDVRLVVVDEVHCVSTWGHDFRPAYREIARFVKALRARRPTRVLALTATADARTEADVQAQLAPITVHRRSMDRPNLALGRVAVADFGHKLEILHRWVGELAPTGLLYCATRDNTEIVAEYLAHRGHRVAAYHAGLDPERKRQLQAAFLAGEYTALSATNALGMGIDKTDLRYVVHVDMPGSITACYQEVGRAGRDGEPAQGLLLYDPTDRRIQEYFIHSARPAPDDFDTVLGALSAPRGLTELKRVTGLHPTRVTVVTAELVEQGFVAKEARDRRQVYVRTGAAGRPDLSRYENQHVARTAGLDAMVAYAEGRTGCLMATLRQALGDAGVEPCGRCSGCVPRRDEPAPSGAGAAWLAERPALIPASVRSGLAEGRALFDSSLRAPGFAAFMRGRAQGPLPAEITARLVAAARGLGRVAGVVPVPSSTWAGRGAAAEAVAGALGVPVLDVLAWREPPEARQGTLLNNDQRRSNVAGRMGAREVPEAVLLLDDYTGSGATLAEAARALKAAGAKQAIPLTIARVRWRLGRPGIV